MTTYKSALSPTFTEVKYINSPLIGLFVVVVEAVVVGVKMKAVATETKMRSLVMMESYHAIKLSNSKQHVIQLLITQTTLNYYHTKYRVVLVITSSSYSYDKVEGESGVGSWGGEGSKMKALAIKSKMLTESYQAIVIALYKAFRFQTQQHVVKLF